MSRLRALLAVICVALLAACVSIPAGKRVTTGGLSAQARNTAIATLQARESRLHALPSLAFIGRIALSNGRKGGSGRIEWRQAGDAYAITLSAPVTRQSWRLTGDAAGTRIEGIEGGPREGSDVVELLRQTTGQEIPVGALAAWAGGARADTTAFGPATVAFGADGRLARLEQDGWTIDYLGWQDVVADGDPPLSLPDRIDARRGDAKVRLAIDAWSLAPDPQ